jgi:hypothetical protein
MTKTTRYFMAGSAAVLGAGLTAGLVAFYAGGFQAVSAAPVASELRYIPAESTVVAYADIQSIMNSDLRLKLKAAMPGQAQGQEEFKSHTGIDIEQDIQYIVAAASGVTPEAGGIIVARGNFNDTQLEALAREHGGEVSDYKGKRLINSPAQADGGKQVTLAFLEPGLVAIGTTAAVQKAIDAQATSHSVTSNTEMMELVGEIAVGNNAWAVGRFDTIASQANLPAELASKMPPVKWFTAAGHVNGGVSGTLRVEADSDESAELLRRQVSGALAFGEMVAKQDPRAGALINSLQLTGTGKTVAINFQVPAELLALIPQVVEK